MSKWNKYFIEFEYMQWKEENDRMFANIQKQLRNIGQGDMDGSEWLRDMQVLSLQPDDIVVLRSHIVISDEGAKRLMKELKDRLPYKNEVILLEEGLEIGVIRPE